MFKNDVIYMISSPVFLVCSVIEAGPLEPSSASDEYRYL